MSNTSKAGNLGSYRKPTADLQIITGSQLTNSSKLTKSYELGDGVEFYSGQPIWAVNAQSTAETSGTTTVAGGNYLNSVFNWTTEPQSTPAFFAFTDSDEFIASGSVMGISTLDNFELQTVFFDHTQTYQPGDKLYAVEVDSTLDAGNTPRTGSVVLTNATPEEDGDYCVVGYVTGGVVKLDGFDTGNATDGIIAPAIWTENSQSKLALQFATKYEVFSVVDDS